MEYFFRYPQPDIVIYKRSWIMLLFVADMETPKEESVLFFGFKVLFVKMCYLASRKKYVYPLTTFLNFHDTVRIPTSFLYLECYLKLIHKGEKKFLLINNISTIVG